ncbi:synapse differentiation-inducing gene protein 1-like [Scyliorhinus canicula]|uniref:synapse differentiation-inducing gene protein 1-like n=1 Tax=Scyliorhinus canicula TaxID=7830 RepID=UPI0018F45F05|nr:synapse differentiation-inducing gene protein 1-like [Scyliorhinus canicula]
MENLCELQRPLLGKERSSKAFSHLSLGRCSAQEEPTSPHDGADLTPIWSYLFQGGAPTSAASQLVPQLLDTCSLQDTVESLYSPSLTLCADPRGWTSRKDCKETTFTEDGAGDQEIVNPKEPNALRSEISQAKVPTVSIDVEELPFLETQTNCYYSDGDSNSDSDTSISLNIPQDYLGLAVFSMLCCFWPMGIAAFYLSQKTSKATAKGNYRQASTASRQTLCTAICSIALGVCTYVGGMVALAVHMSKNGHS